MSSQRCFKGNSLLAYPDSFVCLDIETTGLSPVYEDIIEISALKVRNDTVTASFSEIINIRRPLPPFISALTGIRDEDIANGKDAAEALSSFRQFVGDDILMGHNVNFDINFLYDNLLTKLGIPLTNDYVDTLRLAKRILPNMKHHKLDDLTAYYHIRQRNEHRALNDCMLTVECYYRMIGRTFSREI